MSPDVVVTLSSRRTARIGDMFLSANKGGSANAMRQMNPVAAPNQSGRVPGKGRLVGK